MQERRYSFLPAAAWPVRLPMWLSWVEPPVAPTVDRRTPKPETNATKRACSLMFGSPLSQKSKSSPLNRLVVHRLSVGENADPLVLTADTSVCQLNPARLNMIGYQRTPPEYASMLPKSFGVAGSACCDIRTVSQRPVSTNWGLT